VWGEDMRLYVIYSTVQAHDQANVFEKTTVFKPVINYNAMSAVQETSLQKQA